MIEQNWKYPEHSTDEQKIALQLAMTASAEDARTDGEKVDAGLALCRAIIAEAREAIRTGDVEGKAPYAEVVLNATAGDLARMISSLDELHTFLHLVHDMTHQRFAEMTGAMMFSISSHEPPEVQLKRYKQMQRAKGGVIATLAEGMGKDFDHKKYIEDTMKALKGESSQKLAASARELLRQLGIDVDDEGHDVGA